MKSNNDKRFLIIVIIVLAVMNVTTFATIGYYFYSSKKQVRTMMRGNAPDEAAVFSNRYFMERLRMKPDQMQEFGSFNMGFRQNARDINQELISYRREMLEEMELDSPDTARLNMLSDSIGILHADLKRYTYKYYLNLREISSPEQKNELNNMFREEFLNDYPMGGGGRQQMMGRRQGSQGRSGNQQNN